MDWSYLGCFAHVLCENDHVDQSFCIIGILQYKQITFFFSKVKLIRELDFMSCVDNVEWYLINWRHVQIIWYLISSVV